jgi:polysaccharide biosynthesis/export protein
MTRSVCYAATVAALLCALVTAPLYAQDIDPDDLPPEVQAELDRRGLSPQEALREAERLGIDPTNPDQAERRARELGIPESQIRLWRSLIEAQEQASRTAGGGQADRTGRNAPYQAGPAELTPREIILPERQGTRRALRERPTLQDAQRSAEEERTERRVRGLAGQRDLRDEDPFADQVRMPSIADTVMARVPIRDDDGSIAEVELMLLDETRRDTLVAEQVTRTEGSRSSGIWEGAFMIPETLSVGPWSLLARAVDDVGTEGILQTRAVLNVLREGEDVEEDELAFFGYSVFETTPTAFQPDELIPAGDGYIVGPGDELRLTVWGGTEFQYELQVDPEGRVFVPDVGQFTVAGSRLGNLRQEMRQWLSRNYQGLVAEPPTIFMDVSVTRLRPVQVFVLGEVAQPGGYTMQSGSTVFNALYSVGGPETSGSLRDIRIIRDGETVARVDLYDFLLEGTSDADVRLQAGDYVFIPPRGKTVHVRGEVRRPAIYELREGETFEDVIDFAGGLRSTAYADRFQIERVVPFAERDDPSVAREVIDADLLAVLDGEQRLRVEDEDRVRILSIMGEGELAGQSRVRAVSVGGAVFQPGRYALNAQVRTVRDLIEAADGLTDNAYMPQAELIRLEEGLDQEVVSLNLSEVMDDEPTQNLMLRPQDSLAVYTTQELRAERVVRISGEVLNPGTYDYLQNMTVSDLLFKAGGLQDDEFLKTVFLGRADLLRESADGSRQEIIPFDLGSVLGGTSAFAREPLQPADEIRVYSDRVERLQDRFITVTGAVNEAGQIRYFDGMTLEDALLQVEGFREDAFLGAVEVTRVEPGAGRVGMTRQRARSRRVPLQQGEPAAVDDPVSERVRAMNAARTYALEHRDRVFVRSDPDFREQRIVTVRGEVQFPGDYTLLSDNETLGSVIERAGGPRPTGYIAGGRLVRGDEQVIVEMEQAVEGRPSDDVILQPGDEITIPTQPNAIAVRGNVANEGLIRFEEGKRVTYYLDRAGGLRNRTEAVFITQPSGATFRIDRGWFKTTPEVGDGATILVTREPERDEDQFDLGESLTNITQILSSALTIIVLSRRALD